MSVPELHGALPIIYVDDKSFADESTRGDVWRTRHARLLRELTRAGAGVVALDLTFEDQGKGDDALAAAIREAGATRVIVGAEPPLGDADAVNPRVSPVLKAVLRPGQVASLSVGGSTSALATSVLRRRVLVADASSGQESSSGSGPGLGADTGVIRVPEARATLPLQIKLAWEESRPGRSRVLAGSTRPETSSSSSRARRAPRASRARCGCAGTARMRPGGHHPAAATPAHAAGADLEAVHARRELDSRRARRQLRPVSRQGRADRIEHRRLHVPVAQRDRLRLLDPRERGEQPAAGQALE